MTSKQESDDATMDIRINPIPLKSQPMLSNCIDFQPLMVQLFQNKILMATLAMLVYETLFSNTNDWGGDNLVAQADDGLTRMRHFVWTIWCTIVAFYSILMILRIFRQKAFVDTLWIWVLNGMKGETYHPDSKQSTVITTKSKDIKAGNVVILRSGEMAAMDLLVLIAGDESDYVWVNQELIMGKASGAKKKPLFEWRRQENLSFICALRGFVRMIRPSARNISSDLGGAVYFHGFPRGMEYTQENVLEQGSIVESSLIIAVALQTLHESSLESSVGSLYKRPIHAYIQNLVTTSIVALSVVSFTGYFFALFYDAIMNHVWAFSNNLPVAKSIIFEVGNQPIDFTRLMILRIIRDRWIWTSLFTGYIRWMTLVHIYFGITILFAMTIFTVLLRLILCHMIHHISNDRCAAFRLTDEEVPPLRKMHNAIECKREINQAHLLPTTSTQLDLSQTKFKPNDANIDDFGRLDVMCIELDALSRPSEVANILIRNTVVGDETLISTKDVQLKQTVALDPVEILGRPPPKQSKPGKAGKLDKALENHEILRLKMEKLLELQKLKVRDVEDSFDSGSLNSSRSGDVRRARKFKPHLAESVDSLDSRFRDSSSHGSFDSRLSDSPEVSGGMEMFKRSRIARHIAVPGENVIAKLNNELDLTNTKRMARMLISSEFDSQDDSVINDYPIAHTESSSEISYKKINFVEPEKIISSEQDSYEQEDDTHSDNLDGSQFVNVRAPYGVVNHPNKTSIYVQYGGNGLSKYMTHQSRVTLPESEMPFNFHFDSEMVKKLTISKEGNSALIETYLLAMAICNNAKAVIDEPTILGQGTPINGKEPTTSSEYGPIVISDSSSTCYNIEWKHNYLDHVKYYSSDGYSHQMAFFAAFHGYSLISRTATAIVVQAADRTLRFHVVAALSPEIDWYTYILVGHVANQHLCDAFVLCSAPFGRYRGYLLEDAVVLADFCVESMERDHHGRVISARFLAYDQIVKLTDFYNDVQRAGDVRDVFNESLNLYVHSGITQLGAITFRSLLIPHSEKLMTRYQDSNVQPWLLSNYSLETSLAKSLRLGAPWFRDRGILFSPDFGLNATTFHDPKANDSQQSQYEHTVASMKFRNDAGWTEEAKIEYCLRARGLYEDNLKGERSRIIDGGLRDNRSHMDSTYGTTVSCPANQDEDGADSEDGAMKEMMDRLNQFPDTVPVQELGIAETVDGAFRMVLDVQDICKGLSNLTDYEMDTYRKYFDYAFSQLKKRAIEKDKRIVTILCSTSLLLLLTRPDMVLSFNQLLDASDLVILHRIDPRIINLMIAMRETELDVKMPRVGHVLTTASKMTPAESGYSFVIVDPALELEEDEAASVIKRHKVETTVTGIKKIPPLDPITEIAIRYPGNLVVNDLRDVITAQAVLGPSLTSLQLSSCVILVLGLQTCIVYKTYLTNFIVSMNQSITSWLAPFLCVHVLIQAICLSIYIYFGQHTIAPSLLLLEVSHVQRSMCINNHKVLTVIKLYILTLLLSLVSYYYTLGDFQTLDYSRAMLRQKDRLLIELGVLPMLAAGTLLNYSDSRFFVLIALFVVQVLILVLFGMMIDSFMTMVNLILPFTLCTSFFYLSLNSVAPYINFLYSDAKNERIRSWNIWYTSVIRGVVPTIPEITKKMPIHRPPWNNPKIDALRHNNFIVKQLTQLDSDMYWRRFKDALSTSAVRETRIFSDDRGYHSEHPTRLLNDCQARQINRRLTLREKINKLYGIKSYVGNKILRAWIKLRFFDDITDDANIQEFANHSNDLLRKNNDMKSDSEDISLEDIKFPVPYIPDIAMLKKVFRTLGEHKVNDILSHPWVEQLRNSGSFPSIQIKWPDLATNKQYKNIFSIQSIENTSRLISSRIVPLKHQSDVLGSQDKIEYDHLEHRYLNLNNKRYLKAKVVLVSVAVLNFIQSFWTFQKVQGTYILSFWCVLLLRACAIVVVVYGLYNLTPTPPGLLSDEMLTTSKKRQALRGIAEDVQERNIYCLKLAMRSTLFVWALTDSYLSPVIILVTKMMLGINLSWALFFMAIHFFQFGIIICYFFDHDLSCTLTFGMIVLASYKVLSDQHNIRLTLFAEYNRKRIKRERAGSILQALLPSSIVTKLLQPGERRYGIPRSIIPCHHENTGVMFADIYQFYQLVAQMRPDRLVSTMDNTFLLFDKIIDITGITKIETVGATYLCASNLESEELTISEQCQNLLRTAVGFLDIAVRIKIPVYVDYPFTHLAFKIGLHVGGVYSGLVGSRKPQFALFGDTVNTASRMKLTGKEMRVHTSNQFIQKLMKENETYTWETRELKVKGKGVMLTSLLLKTDEFPQYPMVSSTTTGSVKDTIRAFSMRFRELLHTSREAHRGLAVGNKNVTLEDEAVSATSVVASSPKPIGRQHRASVKDCNVVYGETIRNSSNAILSELIGKCPPSGSISTYASSKYFNSLTRIESSLLTSKSSVASGNSKITLPSIDQGETPPKKDEETNGRDNGSVEFDSAGQHGVAAAETPVGLSLDQRESLEVIEPDEREYLDLHARFNHRFLHGTSRHQTMNNLTHDTLDDGFNNDQEAEKIVVNPDNKSNEIFEIPDSVWNKYTASFCTDMLETHYQHSITKQQKDLYSSIGVVFLPIVWLFVSVILLLANPPETSAIRFGPLLYILMSCILMLLLKLTFCVSVVCVLFITMGHLSWNNSFVSWNSLIKVVLIGSLVSLAVNPGAGTLNFPVPDNAGGGIDNDAVALYVDLARHAVNTIIHFILFSSNSVRKNWHLCDNPSDYFATLFCQGSPVDPALPSIALNDHTFCWSLWNPFTAICLNKQIYVVALFLVAAYDRHMSDSMKVFVIFYIIVSFSFPNESVETFYVMQQNGPNGVPCMSKVFVSWMIPFFLIFLMFIIVTYIFREDSRRSWYHLSSKITSEEDEILEKHSKLLKDMFPKDVYRDHIQGTVRLSYQHKDIGFLFTDIVGFTVYSKSVDASGVLTMLQKMFSQFDELGAELALYKLCTIGDAYISCTEPWDFNARDETDTLARQARVRERKQEISSLIYFAYCMEGIIDNIATEMKIEYLGMRFGLHLGDCIGGIIGSKRLRYDMWGKDIEVGEKMESSGVMGKVNVSETVKSFVTEHFPTDFSFTAHDQLLVQNEIYPCFIMSRSDSY